MQNTEAAPGDIVLQPGEFIDAEKSYAIYPYVIVKIPCDGKEKPASEALGEVMAVNKECTACKVLRTVGSRVFSTWISLEALQELNPGLRINPPPYEIPSSVKVAAGTAAAVGAVVIAVTSCLWIASNRQKERDDDGDGQLKVEKVIEAKPE